MNDRSASELTVYRPDARLQDGPVRAVHNIVAEIHRYRWHIWIAFLRDFHGTYRGTALGVLWAVLLPLIPISVYWLLSAIRVLPTADGIPPVLYISIGVTLWFPLSGAILRPIAVVEVQGPELARTHYPLIGAVMSGFAQIAFDTLVRLVVLIPLYLWLVGPPPVTVVLALPLFLLCLMGCLGLGMVLAIWNAVYRDVGKIATIVFQYAIFVSAVVFPMPLLEPIGSLLAFNPFHTIISSIREILVVGRLSDPVTFSATLIAGLFVFIVGCTVFYRLEFRVRGIA